MVLRNSRKRKIMISFSDSNAVDPMLAYTKAGTGLEARESLGKLAKLQILKPYPWSFYCLKIGRAPTYVFFLKISLCGCE